MIINVEQKHIDTGLKLNCYFCPVALAIKDKIGRNNSVDCKAWYVLINNEKYNLPDQVFYWIMNFDKEWSYIKLLEPFSFELDYKG